ncbi:MAG: L-serine ammonia-lyase [Candidatus Marinimicrobia bacterium]|jgi:L-serine dehydratase|nr:L-serine ammonia-lyase [Candidatus Neomarinimicrobiota bacterium]MBT3502807.1 L-serine ammonia-lyase [Candidatus Neomarinimicrobiota bacterium]MBT3839149.1 L-serine ammonia-lyase [Candidatus Neomarinimicrobiota bacterium]MBT4000378.1 L-serine ammonia-lyase [Candidatus Neomarinimicrobiota bacterium]MBT4283645.1 L-serine ammonia-lyase [Candidatus Neomarinimicrobiota bacterium]
MEKISLFEIFKIGIGPSSSHAMGPWKAAGDFLNKFFSHNGSFKNVVGLKVELFGSLAKTGTGHGTDKAIIMGLTGAEISTFDSGQLIPSLEKINSEKKISLLGKYFIDFNPELDILFNRETLRPSHPNTMDFTLILSGDKQEKATYYSIGGGFIQRKGESRILVDKAIIPYPIQTAEEMIQWCEVEEKSLDEISMANELCWHTKFEIQSYLDSIWEVMEHSIYQGCHDSGELPGGLHVQRRANVLNNKLFFDKSYNSQSEWLALLKKEPRSMDIVTNWISCFALSVNEVNASCGRIVTAPTNGSAGVIPAVIMYLLCFHDGISQQDIKKFLLVSSEIGMLFKKGATISAAAGGCQAEIGVSSAMAAGALTFSLGGNIRQILMAAEIAMEHHLGLTCDPIGGLVQIPCIERNTMGAMKAITAAQLALHSDPNSAKVSLDDVIKTMWETAKDMGMKYKETSEGGLAIQVSISLPEC